MRLSRPARSASRPEVGELGVQTFSVVGHVGGQGVEADDVKRSSAGTPAATPGADDGARVHDAALEDAVVAGHESRMVCLFEQGQPVGVAEHDLVEAGQEEQPVGGVPRAST